MLYEGGTVMRNKSSITRYQFIRKYGRGCIRCLLAIWKLRKCLIECALNLAAVETIYKVLFVVMYFCGGS